MCPGHRAGGTVASGGQAFVYPLYQDLLLEQCRVNARAMDAVHVYALRQTLSAIKRNS